MSEAKKSLREAMQVRLEAQTQEERQRRSRSIQERLWASPEFQKATTVFFFVSMPEEVDTHGMIDRALAEGKRVAVPVAELKTRKLFFHGIHDRKKDLKPGLYGIWEPAFPALEILFPTAGSCMIVPGVVFDKKLRRIGHGAGFYDRFLGSLDVRVAKIGIAYSFQIIDEVPQETHDVALDQLITD